MEFVLQAAAIWMILLLVAALATALMTLYRKIAGHGHTLVLAPVRAAAADLRFAGEAAADRAAVAADRAAVTARRRRDEWQAAQAEVDAAWAAYDEADRAARRAAAATAYPVMRRRRAPGENADRERFLHRSAVAACRNREISIAQLNDALAHRGWNARLHPAAQESALCNAVRAHRFAAYLQATERERQAWETAEQAAAALGSLRAEACAASRRNSVDSLSANAGWWAGKFAPAEPVRAAAA